MSRRVGSHTGSSAIAILLWVQTGKSTLDVAISSGRTESKGWSRCLAEGFIEVDANRRVIATVAGLDYLAEEISQTG